MKTVQPSALTTGLGVTNPWRAKLNSAAVFGSGAVVNDRVKSKVTWTLRDAIAKPQPRPNGMAAAASANGHIAASENICTGIGAGDFAFMFFVRSTNTATQLLIGDSGGNTIFGQNGTTWFSWVGLVTGSVPTPTKDEVIVWTRTNGSVRIYSNGVLVGGPTADATSFPASGITYLLSRNSFTDFPWTGHLYAFAQWVGRGLTANEAMRLAIDPYLIFRPANRKNLVGGLAASAVTGNPFHYYAQMRRAA